MIRGGGSGGTTVINNVSANGQVELTSLPERSRAARGPAQFSGLGLLLLGHAQGFVIQISPAWRRCGLVNQRCLVNYQKIAGQRLVLVAPEAAVLGKAICL
jgi:hypothetical protein